VDVAKDRIPVGLAFPMFVAAFSLGLVVICWVLWRPATPPVAAIAHLSASLCLLWTLVCHLLRRPQPDPTTPSANRDLIIVLRIGALTTSFVAMALIVHTTIVETVVRTLFSRANVAPRPQAWPGGLVDLALIGCSILLAWKQTKRRELVTGGFWLLIIAALWTVFQFPALYETVDGRTAGTHWAAWFIALSAAILAAFVAVTGWLRRRRRAGAWPDALWILAEPPADWHGLRYSVGLMSGLILLVGCVQLVAPLTGPAAMVAGAAALSLAARQWNENLADVALALITLGVTAVIVCLFPPLPVWWTPAAWAEVFNRILLGLTLMAGLWYWLAGVWEQQLHDGRAWTTAGHLVHTSRRVGYLIASLAVLFSFHLGFWPNMPYGHADNETWRWVWGLGANGILAVVLALVARQLQRPTVGWLLVFTLTSTAMFVIIRTPQGLPGRTWAMHWPAVLAVSGGVSILASAALSRTHRWRVLFEPTYLSGVVIAPLAAMGGVFLQDPQVMPLWTPTVTFACLSVVYWLASLLPGPATFRAVAVLCVAITFWKLQDATGWARIASPFYYAMLTCLSAGLWAWVAGQRKPRRVLVIIQWLGIGIAVLAIVAGFVVSPR
jgi:hypothetical protein